MQLCPSSGSEVARPRVTPQLSCIEPWPPSDSPRPQRSPRAPSAQLGGGVACVQGAQPPSEPFRGRAGLFISSLPDADPRSIQPLSHRGPHQGPRPAPGGAGMACARGGGVTSLLRTVKERLPVCWVGMGRCLLPYSPRKASRPCQTRCEVMVTGRVGGCRGTPPLTEEGA